MRLTSGFISAIFLLVLQGCAKEETSPSPLSTKELFSQWESDSGLPLDLTGAAFDQLTPITINFASGATCSCNVYFSGSSEGGSFGLSQCVVATGSDPGCGALNNAGTFTNVGSVLSICNPSCTTYE